MKKKDETTSKKAPPAKAAAGAGGSGGGAGAAGTKACVEQRLVKTLRFPAVNSPSRIEVPVPRER